MRITTRFILVALLATAIPALADDLADAAVDLCEHVRACTLAQMDQQQVTDEMRQMVEPMVANMCNAMRQQVGNAPEGHPLYEPATTCMRSMSRVSCAEMQNGDNMQTPECQEYEKLAQSYRAQ